MPKFEIAPIRTHTRIGRALDISRARRMIRRMRPGEPIGLQLDEKYHEVDIQKAPREQLKHHFTFHQLAQEAQEKGLEVVPLDDEFLWDVETAAIENFNRIIREKNKRKLNIAFRQHDQMAYIIEAIRASLFMGKMREKRTSVNVMDLPFSTVLSEVHGNAVRVKRNFIPRFSALTPREYLRQRAENLTKDQLNRLKEIISNPDEATILKEKIAKAIIGKNFSQLTSKQRQEIIDEKIGNNLDEKGVPAIYSAIHRIVFIRGK